MINGKLIALTLIIGVQLLSPPSASAGYRQPDSGLQLGYRTFALVGMMASGPGLGQSWPGIQTWRSSMEKYQSFSQEVDSSALDTDKKKHMKACAKISSVIKGVTGSSFLAYSATMTIGFGKEIFDGIAHALTGQGHKEYLDLEADHVGARLVYEETPPENIDDVNSAFEECKRLWQLHSQLVEEERYAEADVAYRQWRAARRRLDRMGPAGDPSDDAAGPDFPSSGSERTPAADISRVRTRYEASHRRYIQLLQSGRPINDPDVQEALKEYRHWRTLYEQYRAR